MLTESPQASVPDRRDSFRLQQDQLVTQRGVVVLPPAIVTTNGVALLKRNKMSFRVIQNCATTPVKFLVDDVNLCTAENFHGILAACTATDDGLGGAQSFGITGGRVSIFSASTPRVCTFEGVSPEGNLG